MGENSGANARGLLLELLPRLGIRLRSPRLLLCAAVAPLSSQPPKLQFSHSAPPRAAPLARPRPASRRPFECCGCLRRRRLRAPLSPPPPVFEHYLAAGDEPSAAPSHPPRVDPWREPSVARTPIDEMSSVHGDGAGALFFAQGTDFSLPVVPPEAPPPPSFAPLFPEKRNPARPHATQNAAHRHRRRLRLPRRGARGRREQRAPLHRPDGPPRGAGGAPPGRLPLADRPGEVPRRVFLSFLFPLSREERARAT